VYVIRLSQSHGMDQVIDANDTAANVCVTSRSALASPEQRSKCKIAIFEFRGFPEHAAFSQRARQPRRGRLIKVVALY
jgi:hypothetical protein